MPLDMVIRRLQDHFNRVDVAGAATAQELATLSEAAGALPVELRNFFEVCDGIIVDVDDDVVGTIYSARDIVSHYPVANALPALRTLLPIRGDGCGNYDCLVVEGIGAGAVVFWDHEIYDGPAYLLASCLDSYLDFWSANLVAEFFPDGRHDPRFEAPQLKEWPWVGQPECEFPWPFDEEWLRAQDARVSRLLDDQDIRNWLLRQDEEDAEHERST